MQDTSKELSGKIRSEERFMLSTTSASATSSQTQATSAQVSTSKSNPYGVEAYGGPIGYALGIRLEPRPSGTN